MKDSVLGVNVHDWPFTFELRAYMLCSGGTEEHEALFTNPSMKWPGLNHHEDHTTKGLRGRATDARW